MGRTLRTTSTQFQKEMKRLRKFKQALSPTDKRAFDDIFALVQSHLKVRGYLGHEMPMLKYIFTERQEIQKEITTLKDLIQTSQSLK